MHDIIIKRVTSGDISQLQGIGRITFTETFAGHNTKENMDKYLNESFSTERLAAEISNLNSEFYFAELDNKVAGYIKVNLAPAQSDLRDPESLELERIYVLAEFQRNKIGQALLNEALKVAVRNKVKYIWLGVWENNHKALNFYRKHGFVEITTHVFKLGNEEQTDIIMKIDLNQISSE